MTWPTSTNSDRYAGGIRREGRQVERDVRLRCRDLFRRTRLLEQIIPDIETMLAMGGLEKPLDEGLVDAALPNLRAWAMAIVIENAPPRLRSRLAQPGCSNYALAST